MLRFAPRPMKVLPRVARVATARFFHRVSAEFVTQGEKGDLISSKVPITIGNPEETYIQIKPEIGWAFHAHAPESAINVKERCKLTFFHDTQHFGFESSPYPRLVIPRNFPRQSDANTSPATIHLDGITHEIVLDGTFDAQFAEHASATWRDLKPEFDKLKDM